MSTSTSTIAPCDAGQADRPGAGERHENAARRWVTSAGRAGADQHADDVEPQVGRVLVVGGQPALGQRAQPALLGRGRPPRPDGRSRCPGGSSPRRRRARRPRGRRCRARPRGSASCGRGRAGRRRSGRRRRCARRGRRAQWSWARHDRRRPARAGRRPACRESVDEAHRGCGRTARRSDRQEASVILVGRDATGQLRQPRRPPRCSARRRGQVRAPWSATRPRPRRPRAAAGRRTDRRATSADPGTPATRRSHGVEPDASSRTANRRSHRSGGPTAPRRSTPATPS